MHISEVLDCYLHKSLWLNLIWMAHAESQACSLSEDDRQGQPQPYAAWHDHGILFSKSTII